MPKLKDTRDQTLHVAALKYLGEFPTDRIGKDMLYRETLLGWEGAKKEQTARLSDRIFVTLGVRNVGGDKTGWIATVSMDLETGSETPDWEPIVAVKLYLPATKLELAKVLAEGLARTWVKGMNGRI